MTTNEGQPSGQNPEWELNREQNIAIARRIDRLLLEGPDSADDLLTAQRQFREGLENFTSEDPSFTEEAHRLLEFIVSHGDVPNQAVDDAVVREMTVEKMSLLYHAEYEGKYILVGAGYSKEALEGGEIGDITHSLLPKGFNLPVYIITDGVHDIYGDYSKFPAIDVHEEFPNDNTEDDPWYRFSNVYCFNIYGQGMRIETITKLGTLGKWLRSNKPVTEQKFPEGEYIPDDVRSRVALLTLENYADINSMFVQTDAGIYKFGT